MKVVVLVFSALVLASAETSIFEKASIDAKGYSKSVESEKFAQDNKRSIDLLKSRVFKLEQHFRDVASEQDGLRTLIITNGKKISIFDKDRTRQQEVIKFLQNENFRLEESLKKVLLLLDELKSENKFLRSKFVTNKEFQKVSKQLLFEINKNKEHINNIAVALEIKKPDVAFKDKTDESIFEEVKELIKKKDYDPARNKINYLLNKDDSPSKPRAFYFLGEIEYKNKRYHSAIKAFNASGRLDPNANYMPTLLFHAALSYEKINDRLNAKKYLNVLVESYPQNPLAKSAKKHSEKL